MKDLNNFKDWLMANKKFSKGYISATCARVNRIGEVYDIETEYEKDKCAELLDDFTYTARDAKEGLLPDVRISISGSYVKGLASLKNALKIYIEYLDALELNFEFARVNPCVYAPRWEPMSKNFYRMSDDMPHDDYFDIMRQMEGEYERIFGFGRDEFFRKICKANIEQIHVILSPEIKKKTYKTDDCDIAKKICELVQKKHGNIHEQDILEILRKKVNFKEKILGEFCPEEKPYIILYYKAIGGKTKGEKIARLAQVLAHEYMHYMEYAYCSVMGTTYYQNEFLSEAMADFFGVLYLIHSIGYHSASLRTEKIDVARSRYDEWVKREGTPWPYAEALYFYSVDGISMGFSNDYDVYNKHGSKDKLIRVFKECLDSVYAHSILLNE